MLLLFNVIQVMAEMPNVNKASVVHSTNLAFMGELQKNKSNQKEIIRCPI